MHAGAEDRRGVHLRGRVHPGRGARGRPEERHRASEGEVGVVGDEAGPGRRVARREDDRARPRGREVRGVARVGEEGDVAGARLLEGRHPRDLDLAVAAQLAAEARGQLAQLHAPALSPLSPAGGGSPAGRRRRRGRRGGRALRRPLPGRDRAGQPRALADHQHPRVHGALHAGLLGERHAARAQVALHLAGHLGRVRRDRGFHARALAEHQPARQRDLAPEAAVHDRVLALELPFDVRLRVDDRGLLVRHA